MGITSTTKKIAEMCRGDLIRAFESQDSFAKLQQRNVGA